jgi:hypothetical protein
MTCNHLVWTRSSSVLMLLLLSTLVGIAQNPVPLLNQPLARSSIGVIAPGAAKSTIALVANGSGFVPSSSVNWNGSPLPTAFVNHSRLIAYILSSQLARPSTAWITVVNPAPGGGTSNTVFLPIHDPIRMLSFERTDYPAGNGPMFVATADFRRIGQLDLVTANYGPSVSVLLGNGDGTFQGAREYPSVACSQGLTLGDFNRDGKTDVAVVGCGVVGVLPGNGDGTFQPPVSYSTDGSTQAATADFRGNGKLDLVVSGTGVSILLGNGDGTFQPSVHYGTDDFTTGVAVGDFNGDGKLDVAVSDYSSGDIAVFLGNGDGTFQPQVNYPTHCTRTSLTTADLNGDGKLDLAAGSTDCGTVALLFGRGDGTFLPAVQYADVGAGLISVGDFNADGKVDFAALTLQPTIDIALGNGDGTFQPPLSFATIGHPWDVIPADFNNDGRLDFVNSDFGMGTLSVFLSQ